MSSPKSPFYVEGPINEREGRGKYHGADGSRRRFIDGVGAWCTTDSAVRNSAVLKIFGVEKIGKSSTIIHAAQNLTPALDVQVVPVALTVKEAVSQTIGQLNEIFGEDQGIRHKLEEKRKFAEKARHITVKHQYLTDALRIISESVSSKTIVWILEVSALDSNELDMIESRTLEIPAVFIEKVSQNQHLGSARKRISPAISRQIGTKRIWIPALNESEALNFPCGKDEALAKYCYFYNRPKPSTSSRSEPGWLCRLEQGSLPDEAYCRQLRKVILKQVGCHPFLLARTCKELEDRKDDLDVKRGDHELTTFVRYCLDEIRGDEIQSSGSSSIDRVIESMLANLEPGLRRDFDIWLYNRKRPEPSTCERLGDRGLAYKAMDTNRWVIPEWIESILRTLVSHTTQGGTQVDAIPYAFAAAAIIEALKLLIQVGHKYVKEAGQTAKDGNASTSVLIGDKQLKQQDLDPKIVEPYLRNLDSQLVSSKIGTLNAKVKRYQDLQKDIDSIDEVIGTSTTSADEAKALSKKKKDSEAQAAVIQEIRQIINELFGSQVAFKP